MALRGLDLGGGMGVGRVFEKIALIVNGKRIRTLCLICSRSSQRVLRMMCYRD